MAAPNRDAEMLSPLPHFAWAAWFFPGIDDRKLADELRGAAMSTALNLGKW